MNTTETKLQRSVIQAISNKVHITTLQQDFQIFNIPNLVIPVGGRIYVWLRNRLFQNGPNCTIIQRLPNWFYTSNKNLLLHASRVIRMKSLEINYHIDTIKQRRSIHPWKYFHNIIRILKTYLAKNFKCQIMVTLGP